MRRAAADHPGALVHSQASSNDRETCAAQRADTLVSPGCNWKRPRATTPADAQQRRRIDGGGAAAERASKGGASESYEEEGEEVGDGLRGDVTSDGEVDEVSSCMSGIMVIS